jgi:hypothetical protein
MNRKQIYLFFILSLFCFRNSEAESNLKPWLLTDDYGVLTWDDLATANLDRIHPFPINSPEEKDYRHWQCFPSKEVTLQYHSWQDDKPGTYTCDGDIWVHSKGEYHNYGYTHAWDLQSCIEALNRWKKLARNQEALCLLGVPAGKPELENRNGKQILVHGWVWERLKTKKGCDSFWEGECDPEYWKKLGYKW